MERNVMTEMIMVLHSSGTGDIRKGGNIDAVIEIEVADDLDDTVLSDCSGSAAATLVKS